MAKSAFYNSKRNIAIRDAIERAYDRLYELRERNYELCEKLRLSGEVLPEGYRELLKPDYPEQFSERQRRRFDKRFARDRTLDEIEFLERQNDEIENAILIKIAQFGWRLAPPQREMTP